MFEMFEKVKTGNPIPEKYMWHHNGKIRSQFEKELDYINADNLDTVCCPSCKKKALIIEQYDLYWETFEYNVVCEECGWKVPKIPLNTDYGEVVSEFTDWLAAFNMLGQPKELLDTDVTLFYYHEGDERNKAIEYRIHEEKTKNQD